MWLEVLGLLSGGILGAAILLTVDYFLTEDSLVENVEEEYPDAFKLLIKEKYPDAFKLLIKEKKKNAVKVGIFDEDDEHIDDIEITSSKGVSKSLHKGQTIYV